ncbi:putative transposase [Marinobacter sp. LV10R520-4]|uniref:IS200/IS605 family transposase n=1 Tax=Marinobacter sp. LV10R520-4 TaxID=1761796 RepID=UPI000BF2BC32|nr:IS200/IS605 family transposase [Marinobacter sp. LV10R520-4]PFG53425.1 putative transposase [Marinobacter sp. LV10R520-4]
MKRSHNSCIYKLQYHLVLVTKYRHKCLNDEMLLWLEDEFIRLLSADDCGLDELNGEADHIHALITLHPMITPAKLINTLKTVSSRMIKKEYGAQLKQYYWGTNALWSRSYCLLSVGGAPISVLRAYIENHDRPK